MKKRSLNEVLFESIITGDSGQAIMNQEKRGQSDLVNSDVLPRDMGGWSPGQVAAIGIVIGEPVDDLFVNVTLPDGWKKVATDHDMWSKLIDDQGRERAMIFYKAAFYDRKAHIRFNEVNN